jgi:hypothetical protein
MSSATLFILHILLAQARDIDDAQGSSDELANNLVDKLIDRVNQIPIYNAEMDETTLGKPGTATTLGKANSIGACQMSRGVSPVPCMQDALRKYGIGSSPMQELALTALAASASRDVSMAAQLNQVYSKMDRKDQSMVQGMGNRMEKLTVRVELPTKNQMAGATAPFGYFDPLGFSADCPPGKLLFYREAELKHGRLGMLATLGMFVGEKFHPFFGGIGATVPSAKLIPGFPESKSLLGFWAAAFVAIVFAEVTLIGSAGPAAAGNSYDYQGEKQLNWEYDGRLPGDFGWDPLGLKPKGAQEFIDIQNKEINNGRLAMLAAAGIFAQELVTGQKVF